MSVGKSFVSQELCKPTVTKPTRWALFCHCPCHKLPFPADCPLCYTLRLGDRTTGPTRGKEAARGHRRNTLASCPPGRRSPSHLSLAQRQLHHSPGCTGSSLRSGAAFLLLRLERRSALEDRGPSRHRGRRVPADRQLDRSDAVRRAAVHQAAGNVRGDCPAKSPFGPGHGMDRVFAVCVGGDADGAACSTGFGADLRLRAGVC